MTMNIPVMGPLDMISAFIAASPATLYTLPALLMFPLLMSRFGFWLALAGYALATCLCFALFALAMRRFGIELL